MIDNKYNYFNDPKVDVNEAPLSGSTASERAGMRDAIEAFAIAARKIHFPLKSSTIKSTISCDTIQNPCYK